MSVSELVCSQLHRSPNITAVLTGAAQHRVKPTPPSAAAKRFALAVVFFGEGALVSEGRAARLTQTGWAAALR